MEKTRHDSSSKLSEIFEKVEKVRNLFDDLDSQKQYRAASCRRRLT
jgi:hypothetical protein